MAGYIRQSVANIITGADVAAAPLNAEFNAVEAAFDGSSGHSHDGSSGNAPPIDLNTSVVGYLPSIHGGVGGRNNVVATTNPTTGDDTADGYAVGSVWINVTDDRVFKCVDPSAGAAIWRELILVEGGDTLRARTNNVVSLGTTSERFRDLYLAQDVFARNAAFSGTLSVTGVGTFTGAQTFTSLVATTADINGGTLDNTVIGGTTPSAITGTNITANVGFSGNLTGNVAGNVTGNVTGDVTGNVTGDVTGNVTAASGTTTLNNLVINGTVDFTNTLLQNISTPVASTDAATKGYVDGAVADLVDTAPGTLDTLNELAAALGDDPNFSATITASIATKLPLAGGTMTGNIDMGANLVLSSSDPSTANHLARKAYVDAQRDTRLALTGGTLSGNLILGSNSATSTANPTTDDQLARKGYVDSILGSATAASASAAAASTSESNAATSESNAAASASAAAASYDSFDDRYLGSKISDPSVDNDGDALLTGAIYWNSPNNQFRVYDGSTWSVVDFGVDISQYLTQTAYEINEKSVLAHWRRKRA